MSAPPIVPPSDKLPRKGPPYAPDDPLVRVRGIGPSWAKELEERGARTVADLLDHLPFRHEDRRRPVRLADLRAGEPATTIGDVASLKRVRTRRRGMEILTVSLDDGTAIVPVVFFNRSYLGDYMQPGARLLVFGTPTADMYGPSFRNPEFEILRPGEDPNARLGWSPVYERIGPLSPRRVRAALAEILGGLAPLPDPLPESLRAARGLPAREEALRAAHLPPPETDAADVAARRTPALRRLAYEEFFFLELGLALRRARRRAQRRGRPLAPAPTLLDELAALLPYRLTGAQRRAAEEIWRDLAEPFPMNRLLLGDVGSGKTAVALLALLAAVRAGRQAAMMAPTEILARQHATNLQALLAPAGIKLDLLTAGLPAARQRDARERIADGRARIVVGTHSLISDKVAFKDLGLAVIDEQHRFGVEQRAVLSEKGAAPDLLVMSATPIPRTLAMVMYGDLDVSLLDEKPPGRGGVRTIVRGPAQRERVLAGIDLALEEGRLIYVVHPAVDEGPAGLRAAERGFAEYRARFPRAKAALVHGRMSPAERFANLEAFARGEVQLLVATTVIEVGVDVRAASVIVVEDADHFGLAQLHQLRGRVGRGDQKSYCVLMASDGADAEALERLRVLASTEDGFRVAEKDLELRGPGELAGAAQSGYPSFLAADLVRHQDLLLAAREDAFALVEQAGADKIEPSLVAEARRRFGARLRLAGTA